MRENASTLFHASRINDHFRFCGFSGFNSFGRKTRENRADGTYTTWDFNSCPCGSNTRQKYYAYEVSHQAGGTSINSFYEYFDQFDRKLSENRLKFDGTTYAYTRRDLDALGNLVAEYFPRDSTGASIGNSTINYDSLNRPSTISRPISDSNPTLQTITIYYEGLTTRTQDEQGKVTYKIVNANGQLARSKDHDAYYQGFCNPLIPRTA